MEAYHEFLIHIPRYSRIQFPNLVLLLMEWVLRLDLFIRMEVSD